jgi:hypothetical protein
MNGILVDYHLIFILISFFLFILSTLILFFKADTETTTAACVFIFFNIILCILCGTAFHNIDILGYTGEGDITHNVETDLMDLGMVFYALLFVNIMLFVYACYLFISKPWEEATEDYERNESEWYQDTYF